MTSACVSITFSCGCTWSYPTSVELTDAHSTLEYPCIPETCTTCSTDAPCATRAAMPPAYEPVDFKDMSYVPRSRPTRIRFKR